MQSEEGRKRIPKEYSLWGWFKRLCALKPHFVIGDDQLFRWYLIPKNNWFNIYLHKTVKSDDGRALHDHPWSSVSFLLAGWMHETYFLDPILPGKPVDLIMAGQRQIPWMKPVYRRSTEAHRLVIKQGQGPAWTLFITGPKKRKWGFWCLNGLRAKWVEFERYRKHGCD